MIKPSPSLMDPEPDPGLQVSSGCLWKAEVGQIYMQDLSGESPFITSCQL